MSFINIVLLFGSLQGLFFSISILLIKNVHLKANVWLSALLFIISTTLIIRIFEPQISASNYPQWLVYPDAMLYTFGPLLLGYILHLKGNQKETKKLYLHFIPFLIHLGFMLPLLFSSKAAFYALVGNPFYANTFFLVEAIAIVYNLVYVYYNWVQTKQEGKQENTDLYKLHYDRYLRYLLALILVCNLIWLAGFSLSVVLHVSLVEYYSYNNVWIAYSLLTFLIAYATLDSPEVFKLVYLPKKYASSKLSADKMDETILKLEVQMKIEKAYLNPNLGLEVLSAKLNIASSDLSRIINQKLGKSFLDFVNGYRIEEFKRICNDKKFQHLSITGMAFEAGFNSKSTFNACFKKLTGMTPSHYIASVQNQQEN